MCVNVCVLCWEGSWEFANAVAVSCIDSRLSDQFSDYDQFL